MKKRGEKKKVKEDRSGLFIPSGLFIGMGLGFLLGNFVAWLFIGLGIGFLITALTKLSKITK